MSSGRGCSCLLAGHRWNREARLQWPCGGHADPWSGAGDPGGCLPAPGQCFGGADERQSPGAPVDRDREPRADRQRLPFLFGYGDERCSCVLAEETEQRIPKGNVLRGRAGPGHIFILPALAISWVIPAQELSLTVGVSRRRDGPAASAASSCSTMRPSQFGRRRADRPRRRALPYGIARLSSGASHLLLHSAQTSVVTRSGPDAAHSRVLASLPEAECTGRQPDSAHSRRKGTGLLERLAELAKDNVFSTSSLSIAKDAAAHTRTVAW